MRAGSWATARVGLTKTLSTPVPGSMQRAESREPIPASMAAQTPRKSSTPMRVNTTATAGMITKRRSCIPSMPESKRTFIIGVWGVKRGRVSSSTALVSRYRVRERRKGTTMRGRKMERRTTGSGLMPKAVRATKPMAKVAKDWGFWIIVAMESLISSRVAPALTRMGPAILPEALISPRIL